MGTGRIGSPIVPELITDIPSFQKGISVIEHAVTKYCMASEEHGGPGCGNVDLSRILVAFNGGKDCTLLLHLVSMVLTSYGRTVGKLRLLYICDTPEETFPEVAEFVNMTKSRYGLECIEVYAGSMKAALEKVVHEFPEVRAILMGTRSGDPDAGWMDYFCHTSGGWPDMDLVVPILHMSYSEVWRIISGLRIDYCELYRRGFTSIGRRSNTQPNPLLKVDRDKYLHAEKLLDESEERSGRS